MPSVGADSQGGPEGHADAVDRALNPLHRALGDSDVAHVGAFAHLHTYLAGAIEE
jgi:hypothetical protein